MTKEQLEYLKNWLFRANEDINVIRYLSKTELESYQSTISMHAQQAVEKFLKTFLVYHNVDFPRTHDVDFLLKECQKIDPDDFYIPNKNETIKNIDIALSVKKIVESKIVL